MIIRSMTATFGKLEKDTLKLTPGLNVINAPNEWGKSTWCAFLAAMLYGLDTRAKSTKTLLSDREHYQPWSGSPMSGTLELNWQGRNITIQRSTEGRIPLGTFRAWETESGLEIPELTAENCGRQLLGVERSVFVRTAMIRFRELNVTEDEALRRRLNNLVTTGDENRDMDRLAGELKNLRNKIRYNRSGLLPQVQQELEELESKAREREVLELQGENLRQKLYELEDWGAALENHLLHLQYSQFLGAETKRARAREELERAREKVGFWEEKTRDLPPREDATRLLEQLRKLEDRRTELREELAEMADPEEPGELPPQFSGLTSAQALQKARADGRKYEKLKKKNLCWLLPGLLTALAGLAAGKYAPALFLAGGLGLLAAGIILLIRRSRAGKLAAFYGSTVPGNWEALAGNYGIQLALRSPGAAADREGRRRQLARLQALEEALERLTRGRDPERMQRYLRETVESRSALDLARRELGEALRCAEALEELIREVPKPEAADKLDISREETKELLEENLRERSRVENQLGRIQGKLQTTDSAGQLRERISRTRQRAETLEKTYLALTLARETLEEAAEELQRRFAPRISAGARRRMEMLTGGRYDRMHLQRDFGIMAGAEGEDVLRSALWRSDGTFDQLCLALRLAVAEALVPHSPLILDDALVRFDDRRLEKAMELLKEEARSRQVIVFTCHGREERYL